MPGKIIPHYRRVIVGLVFAFSMSQTQALDLARLAETLACQPQLQEQLMQWGGTGPGFKEAAPRAADSRYTIATDKIGRWIVLSSSDAQLEMVRLDESRLEHIQWDENCRATVSSKTLLSTPAPEDYSDSNLRTLLSQTDAGLIYLWSPHMLLSVDGVKELQHLSEELGLSFRVLLHPDADSGFARTTVQNGTATRCGFAASSQPGVVFPQYDHSRAITNRFIKNGQFRGPAIPGYKHPEHYRQVIQARLAQGK